jgi:hypothetical protein
MAHLFGDLLEFTTPEEFEKFMDNMKESDAINILGVALTYCQQNGMFSIQESHTIYKSLQKLKKDDS